MYYSSFFLLTPPIPPLPKHTVRFNTRQSPGALNYGRERCWTVRHASGPSRALQGFVLESEVEGEGETTHCVFNVWSGCTRCMRSGHPPLKSPPLSPPTQHPRTRAPNLLFSLRPDFAWQKDWRCDGGTIIADRKALPCFSCPHWSLAEISHPLLSDLSWLCFLE